MRRSSSRRRRRHRCRSRADSNKYTDSRLASWQSNNATCAAGKLHVFLLRVEVRAPLGGRPRIGDFVVDLAAVRATAGASSVFM